MYKPSFFHFSFLKIILCMIKRSKIPSSNKKGRTVSSRKLILTWISLIMVIKKKKKKLLCSGVKRYTVKHFTPVIRLPAVFSQFYEPNGKTVYTKCKSPNLQPKNTTRTAGPLARQSQRGNYT